MTDGMRILQQLAEQQTQATDRAVAAAEERISIRQAEMLERIEKKFDARRSRSSTPTPQGVSEAAESGPRAAFNATREPQQPAASSAAPQTVHHDIGTPPRHPTTAPPTISWQSIGKCLHSDVLSCRKARSGHFIV